MMESKKEPVFNSKLFSNLKDTYKVNDGYKLNDPGFENKSEEESSEKDDSDFEEEFMKYNNYLNNDNFDYMKIENNYMNNNTKTNKKKKKKKIKFNFNRNLNKYLISTKSSSGFLSKKEINNKNNEKNDIFKVAIYQKKCDEYLNKITKNNK